MKAKIIKDLRECKSLIDAIIEGIEEDKSNLDIGMNMFDLVDLLTKVETNVYNYCKGRK